MGTLLQPSVASSKRETVANWPVAMQFPLSIDLLFLYNFVCIE